MNWIDAKELALIHALVVEETGGVPGVLHPGALESVLRRPFTSFSGKELFPRLVDKAAALIHSIIAFHPFVDGNKRVALVAADVCRRMNGFRLIPSDEVELLFWSIACGEQSVEDIAAWFEVHVQPWTEPVG